MTPAETNLIEIAKRYTHINIQVSRAYEIEQAKLNLGEVLAHARLSSSRGTRESFAAIEQLAALTHTHKTAMEKVFLACATDLTNALAALPENQREKYRDGLLKSLHGQLAAQSQLYENRGKWIEAAREICHLVETQRDSARFVGESIIFAADADHGRFEELMGAIEEAHQVEAEHMRQILEHFNKSAALLGLNPQ